MKDDVKLDDIQKTSQKEVDKGIIEIKEMLSKIERPIQENNEYGCYGWMMRKKKVK